MKLRGGHRRMASYLPSLRWPGNSPKLRSSPPSKARIEQLSWGPASKNKLSPPLPPGVYGLESYMSTRTVVSLFCRDFSAFSTIRQRSSIVVTEKVT